MPPGAEHLHSQVLTAPETNSSNAFAKVVYVVRKAEVKGPGKRTPVVDFSLYQVLIEMT